MIGTSATAISPLNHTQNAPEMPAILRAVEQLDAETKGIRSLYDALSARLERVLRPVPGCQVPGQNIGKQTDNCPLAETLFAQREHFTDSRLMLESLLDRIQL